ncbi:MAG: preprotein translocase subunit SecE, partial [Pseudomonadota bacterium]
MATNPLQFVQQVRAEVSKVVWPSHREDHCGCNHHFPTAR